MHHPQLVDGPLAVIYCASSLFVVPGVDGSLNLLSELTLLSPVCHH